MDVIVKTPLSTSENIFLMRWDKGVLYLKIRRATAVKVVKNVSVAQRIPFRGIWKLLKMFLTYVTNKSNSKNQPMVRNKSKNKLSKMRSLNTVPILILTGI